MMRRLAVTVCSLATLLGLLLPNGKAQNNAKAQRPKRAAGGFVRLIGGRIGNIGGSAGTGAVHTRLFSVHPSHNAQTPVGGASPTVRDAFHVRFGDLNANQPIWATVVGGTGAHRSEMDLNRVSGDGQDWSAGPWTFWALLTIGVMPANGEYPALLKASNYTNETTNTGYELIVRAPNDATHPNKFVCHVYNNNAIALNAIASSTTPSAGNLYSVACTSDGTTRRLYVNGIEEASTTNSPVPASCTNTDVCRLKTASDATARFYIHTIGVWPRALTTTEIYELNADPEGYIYNGQHTIQEQSVIEIAAGAGVLLNNPVVIQ